jgi:hypothetical protein
MTMKKNLRFAFSLGCLLAAATATLGVRAHAGDPRVGDVDPVTPAEKVERALDGTMNFPPSPAVEWQPNGQGFAADRLFHVPEPGIHPRILFAPEDLPRIRKELTGTEEGRRILSVLRNQVAKGIEDPSTWEGRCYQALSKGNLPAFRDAYRESPEDDTPPGSGFRSNIPGRIPAVKWGMRNPLLTAMEAKALLALVDDDSKEGKLIATAFATYAAFVAPKVAEANKKPRHEFHWYSTRYLVPNELAYGYDWAWKWMTPDQRKFLSSLIVKATAGKYTVGMDLPAHWRNWNHLGMDDSYAACMMAIEGEPGDDPRGRDRIYEVFRDYLTYGIDPQGFGAEGIGYQTAGFGHLSAPLLAFANRGKNLLVHPHWRLQTESWLVQAMQPFGGAWQSGSDLGNFPPNLGYLAVQKYFLPDSPGVDFVFRNHPLVSSADSTAIIREGNEAQWILPVAPDTSDTRDKAVKEAISLNDGDELTYYDTNRGCLYTRTGWGTNDLALHVECRTDTTFANHDHPDRGQFTLAALGRAWACSGYRDTESKYMNVVTIDGRGQGYFTPPGDWVSESDTNGLVTAAIDAKYCWDWRWTKSTFTESEESLKKRDHGGFWEAAKRLQERVPLSLWEPDPKVAAYYTGFSDREHGDPRMWDDEDAWVLRSPWYPVRKAFRTVLMACGKHPYVLVADDIRKDDSEHLYEWRMNMPPDIRAVSINGRDILLGDGSIPQGKPELKNEFQGTTGLVPSKGDRLLLLRTLDIALPDQPTFQPVPIVGTIEYKKTDDSHQFTGRSMGLGTQVVIGSRSAEPEFLIFLYPHRHGDELPVTSWNEEKTRLTISWKDQSDVYDVKMNGAGLREFTKLSGEDPTHP